MNTSIEIYDPIKPFCRAQRKQSLINFFENIERVQWRFYESKGFFNIEVLFADWFSLTQIIQTLPSNFYCQVSAQTNHLEVFTESD